MRSAPAVWVVIQSAPEAPHALVEAIDLALAALAFELDLEVLVTGAACRALQETDHPACEVFVRQLSGLIEYGLDRIWIDADVPLSAGQQRFNAQACGARFSRGLHLHV